MNDIGNELMDIFEKSDRELTFDAMKYDKEHSSDWMELKSTDADIQTTSKTERSR